MEWFFELSIIKQLIQWKEVLEALSLTQRISSGGRWNDWLNRFTHQYIYIYIYIYIYYSKEVMQLKLVLKLHANISSPDMCC